MTEPRPSFGFDPPPPFACDLFHLEPLGPVHNERDHEAWMSSIDHIHATPGFGDGGWPQPMSIEENLADMEMHWREYEERVAFTYSILSGDDVVGCVYVYPPKPETNGDARVRSWVREAWAEHDADVRNRLNSWLLTDWPFTTLDQ